MNISEDNIILLPLTIILFDRFNSWPQDSFIYFQNKNNETVFSGNILSNIDYKNIYNVSLKEGKYKVYLDGSINKRAVSWDIYTNDSGVLKNIGSSDNYKSEIDDGCEPDTFIVSLNDYNKQSIVNSDSANIKSATIDELKVNSIQFGNIPLKMKIDKYKNNYNDTIFQLIYGNNIPVTRKFSYNIKKKSTTRKLLLSYPVKK